MGDRTLTAETLVSCKRILGAPAVSPNGNQACYVERRYCVESDATTVDLFLLDTHSESARAPRRLTNTPGKRNTGPVWSPCGQYIAFVSNRSGAQSVWTIAVSGGEAVELLKCAIDVDNIKWVGSALFFSAEIFPG